VGRHPRGSGGPEAHRNEVAERQAQSEKTPKRRRRGKVERDLARGNQPHSRRPRRLWLEGNRPGHPGCPIHHPHQQGRSILKASPPIPMVSGKGTLELSGAHSPTSSTTRAGALHPAFRDRALRHRQTHLQGRRANRREPHLYAGHQGGSGRTTMVETFQKQLADGLTRSGPSSLRAGRIRGDRVREGKLNIKPGISRSRRQVKTRYAGHRSTNWGEDVPIHQTRFLEEHRGRFGGCGIGRGAHRAAASTPRPRDSRRSSLAIILSRTRGVTQKLSFHGATGMLCSSL